MVLSVYSEIYMKVQTHLKVIKTNKWTPTALFKSYHLMGLGVNIFNINFMIPMSLFITSFFAGKGVYFSKNFVNFFKDKI